MRKKVSDNSFIKSEFNKKVDKKENDMQSSKNSIESDEKEAANTCKKLRGRQQSPKTTRKQKFVVSLLLCHIVLQFFLPYSHFISKVSKLLILILLHYLKIIIILRLHFYYVYTYIWSVSPSYKAKYKFFLFKY